MVNPAFKKGKRHALLRSTLPSLFPLVQLSFLPLSSLLFLLPLGSLFSLLPFHSLHSLLLRSTLFLFRLTCILEFKAKRDFRLANSQSNARAIPNTTCVALISGHLTL